MIDHCPICGGYLVVMLEFAQRSCLWCGREYPIRQLSTAEVERHAETEWLMSSPPVGDQHMVGRKLG